MHACPQLRSFEYLLKKYNTLEQLIKLNGIKKKSSC